MRINDNQWHCGGDGLYLPRVTAITGMFPKGRGFESFLSGVSAMEAERIKNKAAKIGTNVHSACERLIHGDELHFGDYTEEEWSKLEGFANYWATEYPEPLHVEKFLFSEKVGAAGTPDLITETAIIDWKTGNSNQYYSYELQLDAYRRMANEALGLNIKEMHIVQLGGKTKQRYSIKKVKTPARELKKDFDLCRRLFEKEYGTEPRHREYRDTIKI